NRSTHYRAEYFYANHLSHDGGLSEAILDLCLEKILGRERKDDFAAWCCARAFQSKWGADPRVRRALFHFDEDYRLAQREDDLARAVAACARLLSPEEIARWRTEGRPVPPATLKQQAQKWYVSAREWVWQALTWLRRHRAAALAGAGVLTVLLLYLNWPSRPQEETPAPQPAAAEPQQYFSLQVSSVRERLRANRMVQSLQSSGLEVRLIEPQTPAGWFAIRVGRYPSQEKAQAAGDSLKTAGIIQEFLVRSEERQ
ncbi:SPOR domain-containing protein, partial [candidate division KSB1 bacterium]|nr:SPOR domain-containing protein [candidate division KSB1 bacterium]